jgi:predicted HTH domain antitoxin
MELSREKYHVEQLEKSRGDPLDSHKVLVELLEKTPNEVAHELSKEGGLLGKVLDLVKATQIK